MGTTTAPSLKFEEGYSWYVEEGRVLVLDMNRKVLAEFAQGYWTHIVSS